MTEINIISFKKKQPDEKEQLLKEYHLLNKKDFFKKDRIFQQDFPKKFKGKYPTMTLKLRGKRSFGIFEKSISSKDLKQQVNLLLHEIEEMQRKGLIDVNDLYAIINNRLGWELR